MANRICSVSFVDTSGMTHTVEVAAETLYEAAAMAIAEFRRCGFEDIGPGLATRLIVAVKEPRTSHEVSVLKLRDWLATTGKSPKEHLLKNRLRELVGGNL